MFEGVKKLLASRFQPSYAPFQEAKSIYDAYEREIGLQLLGPTDAQQAQARGEPSLERARELYETSLRLCLASGESFNAAVVQFQIALLHRLRGNFAEAIPCIQRAIESFTAEVRKGPNARSNLGICHYYMGQACLKTGQPAQAEPHLRHALTLDETLRDARRIEAVTTLLEECKVRLPDVLPATPVPQGPPPVGPGPTVTPEEPIEQSPLPISPPANIRVVSRTDAGRLHGVRLVEDAIDGLASRPEVIGVAIGESDALGDPVQNLSNDDRLSAVVLVMDPASLSDPTFMTVVQWCITQVASRDEFRLFVTLPGISKADFDVAIQSGDEALRNLADTVQLTDINSPDQTRRNLRAYVARLQDIRNQSEWLRFRDGASVWLGRIATILQLICIPIGIALALWLPVWNPKATLRQFAGNEHWAALLCGIASFPLLACGLFAYTRYGAVLLKMVQDPLGPLWGGVFSFVGVPVLVSAFRIKAPVPWILLGLAAGLLLDMARRNAVKVKRLRLPVDPRYITEKHGRLPVALRQQAAQAWLNPLRAPLWPARNPKVFISYTRSSEWAVRTAFQLAEHLKQVGAQVFLDQKDIPAGANWRRFLNRHLAQSTAFICLADAQSVQKQWPAAEMEAALAGKRIAASPEIIIVKAPDLPYASDKSWAWLPAFRETIKMIDQPAVEGQPRIIEYSDTLPTALAYAFHPDAYQTVSVLPAKLADACRSAWHALSIPLLLLQAISAIMGYVAILLIFTEWKWNAASARWLGARGSLPVAYAIGAFWAGNVARLTLAARFHLRDQRAASIFTTHRNAALGLIGLLALWVTRVSPLVIGWSLVAAVVGYFIADNFCARQARNHPDFLRPDH